MNKGEKAVKLFKEGYNCAQAVVGAFEEELGLSREELFKISSSFGGGMGRLREVCGAVSGMFMVAGLVAGYSDPCDQTAKKNHYALIQRMAKCFSDEFGSIICRELLSLGEGAEPPTPTPRNAEFYKKRPCSEYVFFAAEIAQKILFDKK